MVDQSEVDKILAGGGADEPDARLENLEQEVDLIKNSIKRLLIDLRERINEQDNPFVISTMGGSPLQNTPPPEQKEPEPVDPEEPENTPETIPASMATEPEPDIPPRGTVEGNPSGPAGLSGDRNTGRHPGWGSFDPEPEWSGPSLEEISRALNQQQTQAPSPRAREKLRLQKVHQLFEWTTRAVKHYGIDRLEMMLDSYRALGYISEDDTTQVKEIARLMPASLGEQHEIGSDEFVKELYNLNRILDPLDTSLDRDMIEVMMLQQGERGPRMGGEDGRAEHDADAGEAWTRMMDRI